MYWHQQLHQHPSATSNHRSNDKDKHKEDEEDNVVILATVMIT